jgi:hypothetical protein
VRTLVSRLCNDRPMPDVKIGTDDIHLLLMPMAPMDAPPQSLTAELHLDGLAASLVVVHHFGSGFKDLADFFERQAQDWRGWEGIRQWESLEGDLKIEARHEYGHVQLRVTVRKMLPNWGKQRLARNRRLDDRPRRTADARHGRREGTRCRLTVPPDVRSSADPSVPLAGE